MGSLLEDPVLQSEKLFQSGVNFLCGKKVSIKKAIQCLQRAITLVDNDYRYWQFLGEAYYQRGSLNPAINSFNKSTLLSHKPDTNSSDDQHQVNKDYVYSKLRIADIRLTVGHLDEALSGYQQLLDQDPQNVAALIGLARTQLQIARNYFSSGQVALGHDRLMEALKLCLRSIEFRPDLCITWKLASDCCLIQYIYGQSYEFEYPLNEGFSAVAGAVITRSHCIELAHQFLCRALTIQNYSEYPCLWHNLGISLYLKSLDQKLANKQKDNLRQSLKCLLRALKYDPESSSIRNSIGVVAYHIGQLNVSQHFFIKAIQNNRSTSEMQFSNLGFSYLSRGQFDMASAAFTRCQAEEPLYIRSWVGRALVNDHYNQSSLSLLHHANILGNLYEAQLLYGAKMIEQGVSNQSLRDLSLAIDSMERAVKYNPDSAIALNTLALLYERLNFRAKTTKLISRARELDHDSRILMNYIRQIHTKEITGCGINPFCEGGRQDDQLRGSIKMAEQFAIGSNRGYLLNYIYYLLANQDYRYVDEKVAMLIKTVPENDLKSKISAQLVLGIIARNLDGDYKSYLFKNILDSKGRFFNELIPNLLYLMVFGMRLGQPELVSQILPDLVILCQLRTLSSKTSFNELLQSYEGFWIRATVFCTVYSEKNTKLVWKLVHAFPTSPHLWLFCGLDIMIRKENRKNGILCLKKARILGASIPELLMICNLLLSLLEAKDRAKHLTRAAALCPQNSAIRLCLLDKVSNSEDVIFNFATESICQQLITTNSCPSPAIA